MVAKKGLITIAFGKPKYMRRPYILGTEPNQESGHDAGDVWFTIRADGELNQTP